MSAAYYIRRRTDGRDWWYSDDLCLPCGWHLRNVLPWRPTPPEATPIPAREINETLAHVIARYWQHGDLIEAVDAVALEPIFSEALLAA